MGIPSSLLLCPFDMSALFLEHFHTFWYKKMFQVLILFLTKSWNQPFLQGALVPFSEEQLLETKNWVLGMIIVVGRTLLPDPQNGQLGNICMFICVCVGVCVFSHRDIYMYIYLYITPVSNSALHSCFLPFNIFNLRVWQQETLWMSRIVY